MKRKILFLITLIIMGSSIVLYNPVRTLASLEIVTDDPLFVMHYYGNYDYLKDWDVDRRTSQILDIPVMQPDTSSTFAALNPESYAKLARNFGKWGHSPALLLFTHPRKGYDSVSLVPLDSLGIEELKIPWNKKIRLLLSPFYSLDGMNEYGLAIALSFVPCRLGDYKPKLSVLNSSQFNRIILDNAKNVDQAVELLDGYDLYFSNACGHHLLADASGNAAIIEYIDGQKVIIRNLEKWQVATNFLVSEFQPEGADSPCWRYNHAFKELNELNGKIDYVRALDILEEISTGTIWSVVYNLSMGDIELVLGDDFTRRFNFHLDMETQFQPWFSTQYYAWLRNTRLVISE